MLFRSITHLLGITIRTMPQNLNMHAHERVAIPEMKCPVSRITTQHTVSCNFIILQSELHNSYPYYERKTQIRKKEALS